MATSAIQGKHAFPKRREKIGTTVQLAPIQKRTRLSENYDKPITGREWWRATLHETPVPGAYDMTYFLDELGQRKNTYGFKSDGRQRAVNSSQGCGETLLPGAYNHVDNADILEKQQVTYSFKNTSRGGEDILNKGIKDKDVNVPPNNYETAKYMTMTAEKAPSKLWQFKSQSQRFPTIYFKPKEGPAPGRYEADRTPNELHAVSSSFKSRTPRFSTSHTKVPGPGSYEKTFQSPSAPPTVTKMARMHGIFFSSAFQAAEFTK